MCIRDRDKRLTLGGLLDGSTDQQAGAAWQITELGLGHVVDDGNAQQAPHVDAFEHAAIGQRQSTYTKAMLSDAFGSGDTML